MAAHAHIEAHTPRLGLERVGGGYVSRPVHGARGRAYLLCPVIIGMALGGASAKVLTSSQDTGRAFRRPVLFINFVSGWCVLPRQPGRVSAVACVPVPALPANFNSKLGQHVRQDLIEPSHHHSKTSIAAGIKPSSEVVGNVREVVGEIQNVMR